MRGSARILTLAGMCVLMSGHAKVVAQPQPPANPAPTAPPSPAPAPSQPVPTPTPAPSVPETRPEAGKAPTQPPAETPKTDKPAEPPPPESPQIDSRSVPFSPPGTEILVFLKDGKQLQGILSRETKDEIVVRIAGIDTPLKADTIDRYQILPPILERYRQYRASMGDDPDKILTLVSWLQAREQYELALVETERVLKLDPNNKQAAKVKTMIKSQMELRDNSKGRKKDKPQVPTTQPSEADKARDAFPLLSDQQINLLKVYEIDLANPPRVNISRDTITKMLQTHAGSPLLPATQEGRDAIYRKSPHEVLDLLFKLRARELYAEVQVVDHPAAFKLFRDDVQAAWLVNGCATSACHGGTDAGRLMLMNRKPRADATVYTNFLILDRFRLDDGTPLINYDDPEKSPLLQMALPREDSTRKHPEVPRGLRSHDAWKPTLRTAQDRGFVDTVAWIRSMYRPRPQYPIEYRPPRPSERETPANKEPSPR